MLGSAVTIRLGRSAAKLFRKFPFTRIRKSAESL
jgi:hypothetical protein